MTESTIHRFDQYPSDLTELPTGDVVPLEGMRDCIKKPSVFHAVEVNEPFEVQQPGNHERYNQAEAGDFLAVNEYGHLFPISRQQFFDEYDWVETEMATQPEETASIPEIVSDAVVDPALSGVELVEPESDVEGDELDNLNHPDDFD